MDDLSAQDKEDIARLWCSKENNIELVKEQICFWDDSDKMHLFEFDITSHPRRKEIKKLQEKIKKHEHKHGKIKYDHPFDDPFALELAGMDGISSSTPDKREIIGMVKTGKHNPNAITFQSILGDCFLLTRAKADKKYMILTDKEMYDYFHKRCKAILGEIKLVYLDVSLHRHLLND